MRGDTLFDYLICTAQYRYFQQNVRLYSRKRVKPEQYPVKIRTNYLYRLFTFGNIAIMVKALKRISRKGYFLWAQ